MKRSKTFVIGCIAAGIAVLAVLSVILAPTFGDAIEKRQTDRAVKTAENTYEAYLFENGMTAAEIVLYDAEDRWVALENGASAGVYESSEEAMAAYLGDQMERYVLASVSGTDFWTLQYVGPTDWSGASAVFMGDSITDAKKHTAKFYFEYLKESLQLSSAKGMGKSGSCIGDDCTSATIESLYDRYKSIPDGQDLIVIFMGTNDYGHAVALGDVDSTDPGCFYGSLNTVLSDLTARHTNSQIVVVTPLHRSGYASGGMNEDDCGEGAKNKIGNTLLDYVEAMKNACNRNGVAVIDLYTLVTEDPTNTAYFNDGLHPNTAGHEMIAQIMAEELQKIARKDESNT